MIVYQMGGSRYCDNIGRQHKSNHVMMIVDLSYGIFYQKCMDSECRKSAFKSSYYSIPSELNPFTYMERDEKMFEGISDEDIVRLSEQIAL